MKKIKQLSLVGFALAFILSSCSMDKKVYTSGYHIEWKNRNHSNVKEELVNNKTHEIKSENNKTESTVSTEPSESSIANNSEINDNNLTASTDNSIFIPSTPKINWNEKNNNTLSSKGKATYETKKIIKEQKKQHRKVSKKADGGDKKGKSQLAALLFCIFLGWLGIHRFYLGYTGLGIMYLLFGTIGLALVAVLIGIPIVLALMILIIIDLIRIITGSLKPKGGDYGTKL